MRYTDFDEQTIKELREIHAEFWRFYEVVKQACESGFRSKAANGVVSSAVMWLESCLASYPEFDWDIYEAAYTWDTVSNVAATLGVSVEYLTDVCSRNAPSSDFR